MLSNLIFTKTLSTSLLVLFLSATFSTANAERERKGPPNRKPPEEAFSACAGQSEEGGVCNFNTPDGKTIEGICKVPRNSEASLVCRPNHGKQKGKGHKRRD